MNRFIIETMEAAFVVTDTHFNTNVYYSTDYQLCCGYAEMENGAHE